MAGFLVVVPDILYGDPYDFDNPKFDRESWKKAHSTVSYFLHKIRIQTSEMACKNYARILKMIKYGSVDMLSSNLIYKYATYACDFGS